MQLIKELSVIGSQMEGRYADGIGFRADWTLFLIHEAWLRGCDFEDLATGFGPGMGTFGDWSGIRDSSAEAVEKMLVRTLNFLFIP